MRNFSNNLILNTSKNTKFTFNSYIKLMSIFNNLLCQCNILLIRKSRTVDHYRRETEVYTTLAKFEAISVVKVKSDLRMSTTKFLCIFNSTLCHIAKKSLVCIVTGTLRNLKDNR